MAVLFLGEMALRIEVSWRPISSSICETMYSNVVLETRKLSCHSLSVNAVSTIWNHWSVRANVQNLCSIVLQASTDAIINNLYILLLFLFFWKDKDEKLDFVIPFEKTLDLFSRRNSRYFSSAMMFLLSKPHAYEARIANAGQDVEPFTWTKTLIPTA